MSSSAIFFLPAPSGVSSSSGTRQELRGIRRWIDASTRDYVVEGGRLKDDTGFTSKVVLALSTRLGSCQALPAFGSRLHEIRKADERGRRLAERFALAACAHLTAEAGDMKAVATLSKTRPGAIELEVSGKRNGATVSAQYTAVI